MNILQHVLPGVVVALVVALPAGADEPQRVVYRFEAPATLRAHIAGMADGRTHRIDYHFIRGSCESN